jgi:hypothetical protein
MRRGVVCEIEQAANGWEVKVEDPDIVEKNRKAKSGWQDPEKEYLFPTLEKALAWVKDNADKYTSEPSDKEAFDMAWNEAMTEKD